MPDQFYGETTVDESFFFLWIYVGELVRLRSFLQLEFVYKRRSVRMFAKIVLDLGVTHQFETPIFPLEVQLLGDPILDHILGRLKPEDLNCFYF